MKKILLVGFHKYDEKMYPHLKCFIDKMAKYCDLEYFHFRERGYFMERIINNPTKVNSYLNAVYAVFVSVVDALRLKFRRDNCTIIAIDHYAYAVVCSVLPCNEIILWSHDIITKDLPMRSSLFVSLFMKKCAKELDTRGKVIIQSRERLELLINSLDVENSIDHFNYYYMPVFLNKIIMEHRVISSEIRPRLLQCGGVGAYRYSDDLLEHYQKNSERYRLYLHGMIFYEVKEMLKSCIKQPMVSSVFINPDHLHQIVDYCDIGFIGYRQLDLNFRYIAKASGQLVDFLRVGIPVIVLGDNDLGLFVSQLGVGIKVKNIDELNEAIRVVVSNYQKFSKNCFDCFNDIFDADKYVPEVIDWI